MAKKIMLIVDDEEVNRGLLSAIFEDAYIIKTAKDGRTALSILKYYGAKTSIVLLDLIMPDMDGFEVLQKICETAEWQSIPVIVVSGQNEREAGLVATKLGAADFVTKPVDPEWIQIKVEAAINKADSARLRAENEYMLLQSAKEAKYRTVLDSTGTVVIEYDRLNNAFQYDASISRHIAGNFDGRKLWRILMSDMIADVQDVRTMQEMVSHLASNPDIGESSMTVRLKTPSDRMQWFRMRAFVQKGHVEHIGTIILTFNNIDNEVLSSEKLRYQAERDILTGLYNRTMFFEKAAEMIADHAPGYYVLACYDINKFKVINDQYGNDKGDEVLKNVAQVFDEGFSSVGGICSRLMADDFAVLYPRSFMGSDALAEIHRRATVLNGELQPLSFCVGRYIVDDLTLPVSGMYDRAILAQSAAKGSFDHNIVLYEEAMRERLLREQKVTSEMKNALETEQFEVWFQPQYNHATGALIGAEALVRWRHPTDGLLIPPGEFIPVFERNGFIYEMDKFVWKQSCVLLRRWLDEGQSPLPISVNISRYDMLQGDVVSALTGLIEKYAIPVELLRVEITESAFSVDSDHIIRITKELIAYGFTVEIDDFGSGYSSLNTLKDVPAQVLKLDMRFLENNEDGGRGGNVLESVVRMAKWLGMAVIAEGVETIEQADYLKSIGCIYVQGYLYGKPIPTQEYEALVRNAGKEEKLLAMETVKNLDSNAFWDPESMDTLIFNSYVGSALIAEYHNGSVEMLRVSDKFIQSLGSDSLTMEDMLKLDWARYYEKESLEAYSAAVARCIETGDEATVECVFVDVPGCQKKLFFRITLRVIAMVGERYMLYCLNENITEQRMVEEKEQEASELLQAIMANMNGGVNVSVLVDGVPKVQFANEQYYETRGYTKAQYEAEVLHLSKIIHPEDRERLFHATGTATEPFTIIYRVVRRDGAVRQLINNVSFVDLPGFDGPVQLSVSNDITELMEAEEKERASAEQLKAIMDNINGGVSAAVIRDGEPYILFANEQYYTQFGYTKAQYETEVPEPSNMIHADDRERVLRTVSTAVTAFSITYRIIHRDGGVRWLQNSISMVRLPGYDEPVQLSVINDITELRETAEKERASAEQLQTIMANINGGVTASVIENGVPRILFANERFYSQYGFTKEQFEAEVGDPFARLHPDDKERILSETAQASETNQPFSTICRIIRRDGSVCWLQTNVTIIRLPGVDAPVQLAVAADITAQKELEEKERFNAAQLQAIMDNINGGVAMAIIRDGFPKVIFANEQYYTQRGYTREQYEAEITDQNPIFHKDDVERVREMARTATGPHSIIYRIVRRDGEVRWLQNNVTDVDMPGYDEPVKLSVCNDITELRQAERKEHVVSERLQAILDALNSGVSGVILSDGNMQYSFANNMYYAMLGYTKEQFEAEVGNGLDLIHPDDRARIDAELAALIKTGGSTVFEYRVIKRDGETAYFRVNASMLHLDEGGEAISLGVSNDITDMVKARQQISALSERMEAILENVDSGITASIVADGKTEYLFGNDRFFTLHGYTKAQYEAEVASPFDRIYPDDRQSMMETIQRVNEVGKRATAEYRVIRRDGSQRWMRATVSAQALPDVAHPVLFSVYSDITKEKLAQEKLRAASEQLQAMMDDMPGGFARLRVLPDGAVATEYVNDNLCRMRGMTRHEILSADGRDAMHTIHPDDWAPVQSAVSEMVSTGRTGNVKCRLKHADGAYVPLSVFGRVSVDGDGQEYINVYFADISEQEKKELTVRETVPLVLSSILASSTSLAFAKDRDSRYICASAEFMKMTNFTQESEIIGKTDYEIFPREVADILRSNDRKLLETGAPMLDYVQALPLADGEVHYYKLSKYVLRDTFGNMLGVYGIGRDITEEKSAYARLKLLVDSIPGGIASYIASPSGIRISYFNDAFCSIFGYTRAEYEKISAENITSLTFAEDIPELMRRVQALIRDDTPIDFTYRAHTKNGGYKWVNMQGSVAERHGDVCLLNGVLYDVTERMEAENALRMSEEQFRIAADIGGKTVARYDIKTGTYQHTSKFLFGKGFASRIENVPQAIIDAKIIAPECIEEYLAFYDKLRQGISPCSVDIAIPGENGAWRWFREDAHVMTDAEGAPSQAIIVFSDITELREKETVFKKWQQSLKGKPEDAYMLFRCNLSKNGSFDSAEGKLFWITLAPGVYSFNDRTLEYMNQCVHADDRAEYYAFLDSDTLLANYYRGIHTKALEYREVLPDGTDRWLRLTVELVEYPNSTDVEAFLLYENIDADKRDELHTKELAQTDPLTGVLNRMSFSQAVERIIAEQTLTGSLAILMLDIDTFKQVNDTLGHDMGDRVLKDAADTLRSVLRHDDLLGRLGGDEFLICMRDVYNDESIERKAEQICALLYKSLRRDVQTSTSIGIAVYPRDGKDFLSLYRKADTALYKVKASGKNSYAFYEEGMATANASIEEADA